MHIGIFLTSNKVKSNHFIKKLSNSFNDKTLKFISILNNQDLLDKVSDLDVLLSYKISNLIFEKNISKLKWIQLGNAGVDDSLFDSVIKSKIIVTNSRGINSGPVSEFVMGSILYFSKYFQDCINFKNTKVWDQWGIAKKIETLDQKVIGIIGYGAIAKLIAKQAKIFNMRVIATRRLQRKEEKKRTIDQLLPMSRLDYLISESDYLVVACPLTPSTYQLLNKERLNLLSVNSVLINIARGKIIDEKYLIKKLKNNEIRGAVLDVFENEPLEKNSEIFNLNNVFISPHISGNFSGYQEAVLNSFSENLQRYISKKSLKNRVCKKRLY